MRCQTIIFWKLWGKWISSRSEVCRMQIIIIVIVTINVDVIVWENNLTCVQKKGFSILWSIWVCRTEIIWRWIIESNICTIRRTLKYQAMIKNISYYIGSILLESTCWRIIIILGQLITPNNLRGWAIYFQDKAVEVIFSTC